MGINLTTSEIKKRLQRGANYERLYRQLKIKYDNQKLEIKSLKKQLKEQKEHYELVIENLTARIDQLETMIFGRGGKNNKNNMSSFYKVPAKTRIKKSRTNASYTRQIPKKDEITNEVYHSIKTCPCCKHELTDFTETEQYEEDINLPILSGKSDKLSFPVKLITKHIVEVGYCSRCGNRYAAKDLRGSRVILGQNVRSLVSYLSINNDASFSQIINLLNHCFSFKISCGEISNILEERGRCYLPEYNRILDTVRAGPVHMDETRLPIQSEAGAGYAHVMVSVNSFDVVFKFADNRGKGNSEALIGENYSNVGISDRFGSYKHLFQNGKHQICWAHILRNARDIVHLKSLPQEKVEHSANFAKQLKKVFKKIKKYKSEAYNQEVRESQAEKLTEYIQSICKADKLDPKQLSDLKAGILEYQDSLFVCVRIDGIPADNNKAERALRKLVIKRKKSFGVKTPRGAATLEVLMSVFQTFHARFNSNSFLHLHLLALTGE